MTTLAPAWVNNRTHASPRPDAPPVTSTPLSLSSTVVSFLLHVLRIRGDGMGKSRATTRVPALLRTAPAPTGCTWYTQNTLLIVQQQELYGEDRRQTSLARSPSIPLRWAHGLVSPAPHSALL